MIYNANNNSLKMLHLSKLPKADRLSVYTTDFTLCLAALQFQLEG